MELNNEKLEVLKHNGNTLVIANPGTGKTTLLGYKYVELIKKGTDPKDILCLTFTNKAKAEMETKILKLLKEEKIKFDLSDVNVYTFHSYALDSIENDDLVSSNFLRYSIYKYFIKNEILNYSEAYVLSDIVPKMENLMRYLKSFGILPGDININEVKQYLEEYKNTSKAEMDKFAEWFVNVYEYYETQKQGIDYADMLLEFRKMKNKPKFKHVLIDELQDVNTIEADIALDSGETFFAVGDKKQAIFGFQGGSIINFEKFKDSKVFVLSENYRSTNEILYYAKEYFSDKTKDHEHKKDLENLKNPNNKTGPKPKLYSLENENPYLAVCSLINQLKNNSKQIAVITRSNYQILTLSKMLKQMGIDHSSSYFASSDDARGHVITFVKGVFSKDLDDIKNAMFTPFFPITLQDAFEISTTNKDELTIDKIYNKSPEFKKLKNKINNVLEVNTLFDRYIFPIAVAHGKEYLLATVNLKNAFNEALEYLGDKSLNNLIDYFKSADLLGNEPNVEKQIILTTIHKAKGRQFEKVIYVPKQPRNNANFQDEVVKAILKSKQLDAEEEISEEALRMDFVAMTRAIEEMYIIPDKMDKYVNEYCEITPLKIDPIEVMEVSEKMKRAYAFFVNGNIEKSQQLLNDKNPWVLQFFTNYFESIDHLSFSGLNIKSEDYLFRNILRIREFSKAANTGSLVHEYAEKVLKHENIETNPRILQYTQNVDTLISKIKEEYPEVVGVEERFKINLKDIINTDEDLLLHGIIDAIFKKGDQYLIVDWKTNKNNDGSKHRQQLEVYKHVYSKLKNIPLENIKVAIEFVGLRPVINMDKIDCNLDNRQPQKNTFQTFEKHAQTILGWKQNPKLFIESLTNIDNPLISALIEQYEEEK